MQLYVMTTYYSIRGTGKNHPECREIDTIEFIFKVAEALAFSIASTPVAKSERLCSLPSTSPRYSPIPATAKKWPNGSTQTNQTDIRYDQYSHWPTQTYGHQQRCSLENCKGRPGTMCEKCLNKNNCFKGIMQNHKVNK